MRISGIQNRSNSNPKDWKQGNVTRKGNIGWQSDFIIFKIAAEFTFLKRVFAYLSDNLHSYWPILR
jgi:hypothetical protein